MAEKDKKTGDTSSTSGNNGTNGSSSATSDNQSSDDSAYNAKKPDETPVSANGNVTDNKNGNANANGEQNSEKGQQLSIDDKKPEQTKKPELTVMEKVSELMNQLTSYQLKPEILAEVAHGITGQVMAGINVGMAALDSVVQKVDPIAHATKHFRDAVGTTLANVDNSRGAQLPSQAVGQSIDRGQQSPQYT